MVDEDTDYGKNANYYSMQRWFYKVDRNSTYLKK